MIRPALSALLAGLSLLAVTPAPTSDPIRDAQWHLTSLGVEKAQAISTGQGVTVAVIDTGVDGTHPDLAGSLLPGADFAQDGHGDGLIDVDGHGTATAGLIAAHGRALGVAPEARLLSVRVSNGIVPFGTSLAEGIAWATDHGAQVICVAMGQPDNTQLRQAISKAQTANIVVVAAAGNRPGATTVAFPAAYPGVLAVAGTDRNGDHAELSVSGPQVGIAAPAVEIASTDRLGEGRTGYSASNGTSDATAIIAGAAALVRSKYPNLPAAEVIHRLTATADDKGPPGRDNDYGYGVVNLVKALTADVPPLQTSTQNPPTGTTTTALPPTGDGTAWGWVLGGLVLLLLAGAGAGGIMAWRLRR
jgi:type VII secretion-associated serine protease mycosin